MKNELLIQNYEWQEANYNYLMNALGVVRNALMATNEERKNITPTLSTNNALNTLCNTFGLTDFERNVLLLCAGMELDPNWGFLCANTKTGITQPYPTFMLAIAALPQPHWSAFTPNAPLRRWQLIQIAEGSALNLSPLRIDERVLHYLIGLNDLDPRLQNIVKPVKMPNANNVPSHLQLAKQLATTWTDANKSGELPVIQLCGNEVTSKRAIASTACKLLNLNLHLISAGAITSLRNNEMNDLLRLWEREAILNNSALLLDCDEVDSTEPVKENAIAHLIENISSPLIITSRDRRRSLQRLLINIEVPKPSTTEQRAIWQDALGKAATSLNGHVDILVSHFSLSASTIYTVCSEARGRWGVRGAGRAGEAGGELELEASNSCTDAIRVSTSNSCTDAIRVSSLSTLLWDTCRSQARPRLDELAQPIEIGATWDELVLPEAQRQVLRDITAHVRQRAKVYEQWGFGNKGGRGLGISALFAGASGTGKTMAAEVIAQELRLDLYRIDLSSVVSKYIGETEKNLRRVFDAAETGGAILLFDEADALFGKRSEVKDSHDRHANIEVGYLLQRMESYRGLAILTTNLKASLDQAFLRRIRFIVQFPFPDANQRTEIWQRIFPSQTPTQDLDPSKLAKLNVSGGNIRNIALNAAFLAADAGESVEMKHILQAAKSEYAKLERPLTDAEVKGWI
ncbi:ATP-binding protein [Nostocaceae cyanobacterium CENA369]|uniref:ATP-binding protein n=1 Tax=Dendronalium phyllosphericum CENA369 TaxID=1725256 RepID=A0A8J7HXM1_9NOST|nr:ATP-binding protein [Dendronalium phyllosphericum]MBH8572116.1 ATP-binding protein [Dendronalium phyllosphericum CENA369]